MKIPNSKKNLRKLSCATVVAMTFVGLTGCRTQVKDVMKPLKDGNYEEAVSIFNEANWKDKEKNKFINEIKDYMSQIVSDYASGSITYEKVVEIMGSIADMQITEIEEDFATASGAISALRTSKIAYEDAMEMFEAGNYIDAIDCFKKVIENDGNYEAARNKITEAEELEYNKVKKNVLNIIENLIDSGDYLSAIEKIERFRKLYNKEDVQMDKLYDTYVERYVTQITTKVDNYIKNNMYSEALETVRDAKDEVSNEDLSELYSKTETEYIQIITEKVEGLIKDKDYLEAIEVLKDGKKHANCEKFTELMTRIEAEKPTYLSELEYENSNQFEKIITKTPINDTIGNSYTSDGNLYEITCTRDPWVDGEEIGVAEYNLGCLYSKLYFKIAVDDVSDDICSALTVFGDEVELYRIDLDRKTMPTEIIIDVSNVNDISIQLAVTSSEYSKEMTAIISDGYLE